MVDPIISIVIPCYNHGHFILEALDSINVPPNIEYEVVIVDDGSTDINTIEVLSNLKSNGFAVYHQENKGLSGARNTAINLAKGKYILPLDCDNKLLPNYIPYAVNFLESNSEFSVVYGKANFFGDKSGQKPVKPYSLQELMTGNFVDACAVYRKSSWEAIGGYDESKTMRLGVEDWEFWLHLSFNGFKFHFYNELAFLYRITGTSMVDKDTSPNFQVLRNYIEAKHPYYLNFNAPAEYFANKFKANPFVYIIKLVLYTYFPKFYSKQIEKKRIKRF
ncbi:MAG: glycosyltransferase family 2 protein [Bacteroidia bacterium]|nr:glycosyltransferase family 2 protein [Bacteroidia bacterium]MCF8425700.1 glycosyltransferase family 2 protein [Bacteroidia bacterium]MCF8446006.1 glycosyltransferase family 2 protein [Bacteroidia bacterium]